MKFVDDDDDDEYFSLHLPDGITYHTAHIATPLLTMQTGYI